jgi:hypothetical protein
MPLQSSRLLRRSAAAVLAAGILAAPAAPVLAAPVLAAPGSTAGTPVTDGHGWIGRSVGGAVLAGTRVTGGDGHPWIG